MDKNEQNLQEPQWWVEYVDDYNNKHLAPIQDKTYLNYLQDNYRAVVVETTRV